MPRINDTVVCPVCGQELKYQLKQGSTSRIEAWCSCGGKYPPRAVVETDLDIQSSGFYNKPKKEK